MKPFLFLSLSLFLSPFVVFAQPKPETVQSPQHENKKNLSLAQWLETLTPMLETTVGAQVQKTSMDVLAHQSARAKLQKPFSIGASAYGQANQKPNLADKVLMFSPSPDRLGGLSQQLNYADRHGLAGEFQTGVDLGTYFEGDTDAPSRHNYNLAGTLSYDILQGGAQSPANLAATSSSLNAQSQQLRLGATWAQQRVSFLSLLTDIFIAKCRVFMVARLQPEVEEAVKVGKIQVETKTIGYIDYLNFLDLKNNFEQSRLGAETELEQLIRMSGAWSEELQKAITTQLHVDFNCDALLDHQSESQEILAQTQNEEALAQNHPRVLAARLQKDAAALDVLALKKSQGFSFGPYLSAKYGRLFFGEEGLGDVSAGVSMAYTPPGAQGKEDLAASQSLMRQKKLGVAQAHLNMLSELQRLRQQLQRQVSIVDVMLESLKTSKELMQTLETQRALGFVNSLNYTNAYLGQVRTQSAYLQSVGILKRSIFELIALKDLAAPHDAAEVNKP